MKRGYLALYRKIQDHPFYMEKRVFSKYEAWIDLLMEVQHKIEPESVLIGMKLIECKHGQSVKSLRTWGDRWGWSAKKVSRFLKLLENMEQIRLENVTVTSRITILNYGKYDPKCHTFVTEGKHEGNTKETVGKHECPTDKNVKKEKKEKKYTDDFENFWKIYPKRKGTKNGKPAAFKSWNKVLSTESFEAKHLEERISFLKESYGDFPPDASVWLNNKRWEDEYTPPVELDSRGLPVEFPYDIDMDVIEQLKAERKAKEDGLP